MKVLRYLPQVLVLAVGLAGFSYAAQVQTCVFVSPLRYLGSQWQVKSTVGPVYLARLEGGAWRVLACFDGSNGKYHLDWDAPRGGVYAALDSNGACSEVVQIVDRRDRER